MPSLRGRKRYIGFQVYGNGKFTRDALVRSIWNEAILFFGENTSSRLELWVLNFDEKTQKGFLTCSHVEVGRVEAMLTLISRIDSREAYIHILGVSGTIKTLKRKFLNS